MKAFLLAAGIGSRFAPHTHILPKPSLPFLGLPLFLYGAETCKQMGASEFVMNLHHLPNQMQNCVLSYSDFKNTKFSLEKEKILGGAGGLAFAKRYFHDQENFIYANADEVLLAKHKEEISEIFHKHIQSNALASLLVMEHSEAGKKFGGIWTNKNFEVKNFGKSNSIQDLKPLHFTGFMLLNKEIFNHIPEGETNIFYDVLIHLLNSHKIIAHKISASWFETGNLNDYLDAQKEIIFSEQMPQEKNYLLGLQAKYQNETYLKSFENLMFSKKTYRVLHGPNLKYKLDSKLDSFAILHPNLTGDVKIDIVDSVVWNPTQMLDSNLNRQLIL